MTHIAVTLTCLCVEQEGALLACAANRTSTGASSELAEGMAVGCSCRPSSCLFEFHALDPSQLPLYPQSVSVFSRTAILAGEQCLDDISQCW